MTLTLLATATVACALAFVFALLTWRRVLARWSSAFSIVGGTAFFLLAGGNPLLDHPWFAALFACLGGLAILAAVLEQMAVMAARRQPSPTAAWPVPEREGAATSAGPTRNMAA
jgi:hypothetical protein